MLKKLRCILKNVFSLFIYSYFVHFLCTSSPGMQRPFGSLVQRAGIIKLQHNGIIEYIWICFTANNGSASGNFHMVENTSWKVTDRGELGRFGLWLQAAPDRKKTGGEGDICIHCIAEKMWEEEKRQSPMGGFPRGRQHLNNKDRVRQVSRKEWFL